MKRALLLAVLVVNLLHSSIASAQERTEWAPLAKSLTVLLNEGWRIIAHGNSKAVTQSYEGGIGNNLSELYTFVLAKESKVVICLIYDPQPNNAASRCRALN
jgi:hypothetical protein